MANQSYPVTHSRHYGHEFASHLREPRPGSFDEEEDSYAYHSNMNPHPHFPSVGFELPQSQTLAGTGSRRHARHIYQSHHLPFSTLSQGYQDHHEGQRVHFADGNMTSIDHIGTNGPYYATPSPFNSSAEAMEEDFGDSSKAMVRFEEAESDIDVDDKNMDESGDGYGSNPLFVEQESIDPHINSSDHVGGSYVTHSHQRTPHGPITSSKASQLSMPVSALRNRRIGQVEEEDQNFGHASGSTRASRRSEVPHHGSAGAGRRSRKGPPESDPENSMIKFLRTQKRLSWGTIANKINKDRARQGQRGTLSEAAVYGRFVRNAPRIARMEGDTEFDASEWMHLHKSKKRHHLRESDREGYACDDSAEVSQSPAAATLNFSNHEDAVLMDAYKDISPHLWEGVASNMQKRFGRFFDPEECEARFRDLVNQQ